MKIMKILVTVCLVLMTTCFAAENATTELEQQLKVQKREKQYLIEDDPNENEGPEQKRDERQSTPVKNNHNLDPKGNSRIINIRLKPTPNILAAPKQALKPGVLQKPVNYRIDTTPQRIPTKIPVILKTAKVIPSPAHALRLKMLENQINESKSNLNKENILCPNTVAPPTLLKDSLPYFTIEDKTTRRTESRSSPNNIIDETPNLVSNATLNTDGKESLGNDGKTSLNKDSNDSLNEGKDDQITSNSDRKATRRKNKENSDNSETAQKPVHFFVDEPEPLPPSTRRQQTSENTASQSKEVTPNKIKEMPIVKKGNSKPKKDEPGKKDNENDDEANDPDVIRISNGTHLISIKKIRNDRHKIERLVSRDGEENTVPTEERIVNQEPPKPKLEKPVDEPEKHYFSVTDKSNTGIEQKMGLSGLAFRDSKSKEEKDQNDCITTTKHKCDEFEEKSPIAPLVTLQPANPPTFNEGIRESWNYLQNPYYNPYYQNIYDQFRKNYGLAHGTPKIYGQESIDPRDYGVQINPYIYSQPNTDPNAAVITLPYYPNGKPATDTDSTQYSYHPYAYENRPQIDSTPCPGRTDIRPETSLDKMWRDWKDIEIMNRIIEPNDTEAPLDIDIRRSFDDKTCGNQGDLIGKVANPYATSSLPINVNGALVYPYVNPGYRYMR